MVGLLFMVFSSGQFVEQLVWCLLECTADKSMDRTGNDFKAHTSKRLTTGRLVQPPGELLLFPPAVYLVVKTVLTSFQFELCNACQTR